MLRILIALAAVYLLVLTLAYTLQRGLLYHPTRLDLTMAERMAKDYGMEAWRNRSGHVIGWKWPAFANRSLRSQAPAGEPAERPLPSENAVLVVHGNAGSAFDRSYLADPVRAAGGVDVFVLEYPGYGVRDGAPGMASWLSAADEAIGELASRAPLYIVGESIGAGPAAHLARTHGDRVSGLLFFAPFTTLQAVAQKAFPFLPAAWLLRDKFDPAGWLSAYRGPAVFVIAEADEVIPPAFGRALHDGYAGPKRLTEIPGAGHNTIQSQSPAWWSDVFTFWRANAR